MSVTVYGASDDLIEVEGDISEEFNALGNFGDGEDDGGILAFDDGNVLRVTYTSEGVWRITPTYFGKGAVTIVPAVSADDEDYSDRATIDGQLRWVVFGSQFAKASA